MAMLLCARLSILYTLVFGFSFLAAAHLIRAAVPALPSLVNVTVDDLARGLENGHFSSVDLVQAYLHRISEVNPTLKAVTQVNPDALKIAKGLDKDRATGKLRGPLHGIPLLIKDNIATKDKMDNTAGSFALVKAEVPRDATVVDKLRKAGVVILGKTNLSQWANFRSTNSSNGWSATGGQTEGAYYPAQDPSGSSSGSGVAASVGLALAALGTETSGSIVSPGEVNNLVGIKPTVGLTSRALVIPISQRQDTVGPMARSVKDAAYILSAIAGKDPNDNYTSAIPFEHIPDYVAACNASGLRGARIGVPRNAILEDRATGPILAAFEAALAVVAEAEATIVDNANYSAYSQFLDEQSSTLVLLADFVSDLPELYLSKLVKNPQRVVDLASVSDFTKRDIREQFPERNVGIWDAALGLGFNNTSPEFWAAYQALLEFGGPGGILGALERDQLDALVLPTALAYSLPAIVGYPLITVPLGFYPPDTEVIQNQPRRDLVTVGPNIPFGISFIGRPFTESKLISYAERMLHSLHNNQSVFFNAIQHAMVLTADDIPPVGAASVRNLTRKSQMTRDVAPPVASVKRGPPPEKLESIRLRSFIVLSFWFVVVFLGLVSPRQAASTDYRLITAGVKQPIWWRTTSIYRARLPLGEMMDWAEGRACRPVFPLQISLEAPSLGEQDAQHLLRLTQHALDDLNDFSAHHLRLQLSQSMPIDDTPGSVPRSGGTGAESDKKAVGYEVDDIALTVKLLPGDNGVSPTAELDEYSSMLRVTYAAHQIPSTSSTSAPLASFLANQLQDIFAEEQAMMMHILSASTSTGSGTATTTSTVGGQSPIASAVVSSSTGRDTRSSSSKPLSADVTANLARLTTRSVRYSPTYHLTFSLFTPKAVPSSWDIETALKEHFTPLLDALSVISNFTLDTQVQLYADRSPSVRDPTFDSKDGVWVLQEEDLSGFINAAEWPLSPGIGEAPTINFVVYVPDALERPLVVGPSHGQSWLIPQWGGVTIINPSSDQSRIDDTHLTPEALRPALLAFSHQLLSLLGTPRTPSSLPVRLLTMTRVRSASLLLSASSTMGSLARLTLALPSISIPQSVANSVDRTIMHLHGACADFRDGRFRSALQHGRVAEAEAERGFFEKSMVGQVYFPDEHKVAVYLPLLGPVGVPLILGALKEARRAWSNFRAGRKQV
ncbi:MAG: GPI transamidase component [Caeruleum heppii]|nr:MAG: GPI transamidase component [Caeruleum heppii]